MEETRVFTGFMDLDSAPESIREGDFLKSRNLRRKSTTGSKEGRLSFSNDFVPGVQVSLPTGSNKNIKVIVNDPDDSMYAINYNSEGLHTLVRYSGGSGQVIFTNMTDTGSQDLLNWTPDTVIADAVVHLNRWLVLTDTENEVRMFDLKRLQEGYGRVIVGQDITLAKAAPLDSPQAVYDSAAVLGYNNLLGNLYRFKYKFIYEGGFESAWSATSAEVLPDNLNSVTNGMSSERNNILRVNIPIRPQGVETVVVASSTNGGEWVVAREMRKEDIDNLPTSRTEPTDEIRLGPYWVMSFYNPLAFNLITADEADHNYDAIPRKAKTLDIVNNNTLLLGGLTEGYERLSNLAVTLNPAEFSITEPAIVTGRGTLRVSGTGGEWNYGDMYQEFLFIRLQGTPTPGDIIKVTCNYGLQGEPSDKGNANTADVFQYTVLLSDTTLSSVYSGLANALPNGSVLTDSSGEYVRFSYGGVPFSEMGNLKTMLSAFVDLTDIGYVDQPTYRTFKKGSTIQFALSYKDAYGRYFPLETDSTFKVTIPRHARNGYRVAWTINHQPPAGAVSYQWMVSEDMKYLNYVDLMGEWEKAMSKPGRYMIFNLTSLNRYNNRGIPGISYTYTPGDRVYLYSYTESYNGGAGSIELTFGKPMELEVLSMDIVALSHTDSQYLLKVQFNQEVWDELVSHSNSDGLTRLSLKMEIFSPKVITNTQDTTLFREIGPTFLISDGNHTETNGYLEGIDDFLRARVFENFTPPTARGFVVESRTISDDTSDIVPFRGNVRSYNDQIVGRDLRGSIRYSDISNTNMRYNGINRFFEGRIYGEGPGETTSRSGWITKIKVVGNYLKVLQEDEVGVIPVYLSIIQDNSGAIQTADSDKLLNTVRLLGGGKVGTGKDPRSFAIDERGSIFFFDSDRKVPFKLSGMTLTDISSRMGSYFSSITDTVVLGSTLFSPHNEYWMTFSEGGTAQTLVLDTESNRWETFSDNVPEAIGNLNGEVYGFKGGQLYNLDKNSLTNTFYGVKYPSTLDVIYPASFVRTFKSIAVHADTLPETVEDGIKTSLDLVSDLVKEDFKLREGIWYANFLRDKPSGLFTGKFLKGKWLSVNLKFDPQEGDLNLFKVVVKSKASTANE